MKVIFLVGALMLMLSECSNTWSGVKKDSSNIWETTKQTTSDAVQDTKEAIHKATE
jgi:predicted small secreted protein